eukprot:Gregarina_sp_Pseudo_9__5185@NODE_561_length_2575_cov_146_061909_g530_i0_p1_GENE_NODE_561_length_2575_cov_146_061909_g530_i0NODE_561_length_2575_cov_146_061909_g530_i0_p1_ORF_typecomplete_len477_score97_33PUB/PF09409_10/1_2e07_NODE_561_length_2575_cov_146_061909_g530_i02951725
MATGGEVRDEVLIAPGSFSCLRDLEKRTSIYKAQSSVFASLVKRFNEEPGNASIVLDCRSRDQVQNQTHEAFVRLLKAVNVTSKLPHQAQCSNADRDKFKNWLEVNTHLRDVFVFDCQILADNTFLSRVLKYIGRTSSKPKRVVVLAAGLDSLAKNPIAKYLLRLPVPFLMASSVKVYGVGSFVSTVEVLGQPSRLVETALAMGISNVLNLTYQTCALGSGARVAMHDMGSAFLPLKSEEKALDFYAEVFKVLIKASANKSSILIVDTPLRGFASVIMGIALVEIANLPVVDAIGLLKSRLNPPELDSYTKAAMSHLSDRSVASPTRIERAITALAAKYRPVTDSTEKVPTNQTSNNNQKVHEVFEGLQPPTMRDKWEAVEKYLGAHPHSREALQQIYTFISNVFNNVLVHPYDPKYKQLKMTNPKVRQILGNSEVARMLMEAGGWVPEPRGSYWCHDDSRGYQGMRDVLVYISNV